MRSAFGQRCAAAWRENQGLALLFSRAVYARRDLAATGTTRLYLIHDAAADAVKIGVSRHPVGRFANVQVSNPHELSLEADVVASGGIERIAHSFLAAERIRGEWFRCTPLTLTVCELLYALGDWEDADRVVDGEFAAAVLYADAEDLELERRRNGEAAEATERAEA